MTLGSTGNQKLKTLIERKCVSSMKTKGPASNARGLSSRFGGESHIPSLQTCAKLIILEQFIEFIRKDKKNYYQLVRELEFIIDNTVYIQEMKEEILASSSRLDDANTLKNFREIYF